MGIPQHIAMYVWYASTFSWTVLMLVLLGRRATLRYPALTAYSLLSVVSGIALARIGPASLAYGYWWVFSEYGFASLVAFAVLLIWHKLTSYYPRMGGYGWRTMAFFVFAALAFGWLGDLDLNRLASNQIYAAGVIRRIIFIAATLTLLFIRLLFGSVWHTFPANIRVHFRVFWFFCAGSSVAYLTLTQLLHQRLAGLICNAVGIVACWWWVLGMSRYGHVTAATEYDPAAAAERAVKWRALMQVLRQIIDSTKHQRCY